MRNRTSIAITLAAVLCGCSSGSKASATTDTLPADDATKTSTVFNADSAYSYVAAQVAFGPRVPNTAAHEQASQWLASELKRHGAEVSLQMATLNAFDGTPLKATNIIGQYNPGITDGRLLLLAHYDCRPWADSDPDPANHNTPVDGANDGASGVGVLLEIARQLNGTDKPIDILFVDAEDWGDHNIDESWALGAKYFVQHPFKAGYKPANVILLDMVGSPDAVFSIEYFSEKNAPELVRDIWLTARKLGLGSIFPAQIFGGATDDHIEFQKAGIPAIDIIDYRHDGFDPVWHTTKDNMENISATTLGNVGKVLMEYIANYNK